MIVMNNELRKSEKKTCLVIYLVKRDSVKREEISAWDNF